MNVILLEKKCYIFDEAQHHLAVYVFSTYFYIFRKKSMFFIIIEKINVV